MDFGLTREQEMLRNMVKDFAEKELRPRVEEFAQPEGEWPFDIWKKMANLGLIGLPFPKEYGGSGMGHLARIIAIEEIAKVYPGWGGNLRGFSLLPYVLVTHGTEEQKKTVLPRLLKGEIQASLAGTEASGGSDVMAISTTAKREGDYYIVNGRKCMISRSTVSDLFLITARTGENQRDISSIIIERNTPGFEVGRLENFVSKSKSSPVGEFTMTNCKVPVKNLVGKEHRGITAILTGINEGGRTGGAAMLVGLAQTVLEISVKYAKERHLYGKPLTDIQTLLYMLGDMERNVARARWLTYYVGWLLDQGKTSTDIGGEIAMCKLDASEAAINNCLKGIELLGGYGTTPEFGIIGKFKSALDMIGAAGSNNVSRLVISNATVKKYS
jgi:alkylation response protein AidB-like acyl-CoA dehydrogenase